MFKKDVDYSLNILPACLASKQDNFEGYNCYFAGWGLTFSSYFDYKSCLIHIPATHGFYLRRNQYLFQICYQHVFNYKYKYKDEKVQKMLQYL